MKTRMRCLAAMTLAVFAGAVGAQDATALHARALAATCAACHGTDGKAAEGSAIPALAGMPSGYLATQMKAFREGTRPATVMHQLARGLTESQVDTLASYFASIRR